MFSDKLLHMPVQYCFLTLLLFIGDNNFGLHLQYVNNYKNNGSK